MDERTFHNTRAALVEYDRGEAARLAAWSKVETNEDVWACDAADRAALLKVQEAFHKDTSDINNMEHCRLVGIGFMRKMARETM